MTITVNIKDNRNAQKQVRPSDMPCCDPFLVKRKDKEEYHIVFRLGGGSALYIDNEGDTTYTNENNQDYLDKEFEVVPNAKIHMSLNVTLGE